MFQLGAWMVGDTLNIGTESLSTYVDAFQRYLDGEKFQQDKQVVQGVAEQLGKEVQGAARVFGEEVKKITEDLGAAEQKAANAINQFGKEVVPVLNEFSKSGQAVVEELEKFSENIQQQNPEAKELGGTVLSSLLETLEKVNNSLEPQQSENPSTSSSANISEHSTQKEPSLGKKPSAELEALIIPQDMPENRTTEKAK